MLLETRVDGSLWNFPTWMLETKFNYSWRALYAILSLSHLSSPTHPSPHPQFYTRTALCLHIISIWISLRLPHSNCLAWTTTSLPQNCLLLWQFYLGHVTGSETLVILISFQPSPLRRHQFPSVSIFSIILHDIPDHCHLHLNCWSGSLTLLLELGFPLSCILSVWQQYSQCHILCHRYVINVLSVSRNPMVFLTFQLLSMPSLSTHTTDFLRH